jgi:hypothetical protein
MARNKKILNTIARLAKAENVFLRARFLAPVIAGEKVQVRIDGVRCEMAAKPRDFSGWGIFAPVSHTEAKLERPATLKERLAYGRLFPSMPLILVERLRDDLWLALPARHEDQHLANDGLVMVNLIEDAEMFDTVRACGDGTRLWFIEVDGAHDPAASAYLRQSLITMRPPRLLDRPGLTLSQRLAYAAAHEVRLRHDIAQRKVTGEERVRDALAHAGAKLVEFAERGGTFQVAFDVDGRRHYGVVGAKNLALCSAGVCLSGRDRELDLTSLVSVLRAGQRHDMHHGTRV